jgi:hypothetical protein
MYRLFKSVNKRWFAFPIAAGGVAFANNRLATYLFDEHCTSIDVTKYLLGYCVSATTWMSPRVIAVNILLAIQPMATLVLVSTNIMRIVSMLCYVVLIFIIVPPGLVYIVSHYNDYSVVVAERDSMTGVVVGMVLLGFSGVNMGLIVLALFRAIRRMR